MLGEPLALLEPTELTERVAPEAAVDLGRDERVAVLEEPRADRVARPALGTKSISSVFGSARSAWRIALPTAQYVALPSSRTRSSGGATSPASTRAEARRRRGDPRRSLVGEPPRARADARVEDDARAERLPRPARRCA